MGAAPSIRDAPVFSVRGRLYRILDTVGQGSEATVYRCEDQTAAQYAVKVFYFSRYSRSDARRRIQSFTKEARMLKSLSARSQYVVRLFDYEYKPEEHIGYMIMELGDGSLREHLVGIPLDDQIRGSYWRQIVTILKDLQNMRVVHADIKPDNLILVNNVLKVADLGLAFRVASPKQTVRRPAVRGTLDYMAPEVFSHQTGHKSDVWSAGIILYEMTYGRPPYFGIANRNQKVVAISSAAPFPFPSVRDRYLSDCMKRSLSPNPMLRPSAQQLQAHPYTRMH